MSIDFSAAQKNRSGSMASFLSAGSNGASNNGVEVLINYLTHNVENIMKDKEFLHRFEFLTNDTLLEDHDVELHRIVKSHGWTGSHYRTSDTHALDAQALLQALSNLYLRHKMTSYTAHISNMFGLGDEKGADQILSFCPDLLLTCLREQKAFPATDSSETKSFTFSGACMLADISGFSKFSAAMCQRGVEGLDELRETTNGFLGHIVKLVYEHKGDGKNVNSFISSVAMIPHLHYFYFHFFYLVVAFAGDALICVFQDTHDAANENSKGSQAMENCCYRALKCACKLREHKTNKLSSHIGVSYGEMKLALLGGVHDQWVYLLNGSCVSELADCINDAGPKEVVVTRACFDEAMKAFEEYDRDVRDKPGFALVRRTRTMGRLAEEGGSDKEAEMPPILSSACESGNVLIKEIDTLLTPHETIMKASSSRKMSLIVKRTNSRQISFNSQASLSTEGDGDDNHSSTHGMIEQAAMFVPRPVLAAVYSESLEHIGELREVTTMFLSLDSYSPVKHRDPTSLQPFFKMAQRVLFDSGGFLRQFLVDDKGCVFIAMWGMPSFTYANNCSRALYCAVDISFQAKDLDHACSIGITTGNVFCGSVGAPERRDYAGIGNEVNLAARLMSKAHGRVLLDNATYSNLNEQTKTLLITAEEMKLKGMDQPVVPYAYNSTTIPRVAAVDENTSYGTILRKQVKAVLNSQIDKIVNGSNIPGQREVHFTLILGLPGTGKSTAAEYFRLQLRKHNILCVLIQARPGHEGVPYGLMRELFLELIGEDNFDTEAQQRHQITYLVEQAYPDAYEEEKRKARLSLEIVLGVGWSEMFLNVQETIPRSRKGSELIEPQRELSTDSSTPPQMDSPMTPTSSNRTPLKTTSPKHNDLLRTAVSNTTNASSALSLISGINTNNSSPRDLEDDVAQHFSRIGDKTFYKVLAVLLNNQRAAIVIEDAHYCDELSWNELHMLEVEGNLNLSVLITMRSQNKQQQMNMNNASSMSMGSPGGVGMGSSINHGMNRSLDPVSYHGSDRGSTKRKSVLASVNADSTQADILRALEASSGNSTPVVVGSGNQGTSTGLLVGAESSDATSKFLKLHTSAAYMSIMGHDHSQVLEMNSLTDDEVRDILKHTLKVEDVSNEVIRLVMDVSSGNAYWCKAIANFIKERGVKELEKATAGDSKQNSLKQLILLRMEKLSVDQQLVLKYASIIGDEFSDKMLQNLLPDKLKGSVKETMESLSQHGFIVSIQEGTTSSIYGFDNSLIQQTISELMPPRYVLLFSHHE